MRDFASTQLALYANTIKRNGDTVQMEAMANIIYEQIATQSNPELRGRIEDVLAELLPLAIDRSFYALVHPLGEWLRHPNVP